MRIIRLADLAPAPWRNGGGVTREIWRADRDGALAWRLSLADVAADGPFSDFAGLVRVLTVVEGAGMDLVHDQGSLAADRWGPSRFDGGLAVVGRLRDGPIRDLNLIFDPRACEGGVVLAEGPAARLVGGSLAAAVHAVRGEVEVSGPDGSARLAPGDTALREGGPLSLSLAEGAAALLVALGPPAQSDAISEALAAR